MLFYNGGATTQPFTRCDLVQQVSPEHLASALGRGELPDRQFLLPHAMGISRDYQPVAVPARAALRAELGIPADANVVLSVGALEASVKRMDYVIDEVATMASRPYLVLLGAVTGETASIREHATERLAGRCIIRTLSRDAVRRMYAVADVFVLASLLEGFGLAQVEALAAGIPCVAHTSPTAAYVLGDQGILGDLRHPGMLAPILEQALRSTPGTASARHAYAYGKFSWDVLTQRYVEMFVAAARGVRPAFAELT